MHSVIFSSRIHKAEFIQTALAAENLTSTILNIRNKDLVKVSEAEGFIIFLTKDLEYEDVYNLFNYIKKHKAKSPIFMLLDNQNIAPSVYSLILFDAIFSRPFLYQNIAILFKHQVFMKKENDVPSRFTVRDLELNTKNMTVKQGDQLVKMRNKEFALLHFLMANKGRVLSRNTILENVWDRNTNILTNTVDVHINQLRRKIEKDGSYKYIHTINCAGYLLE